MVSQFEVMEHLRGCEENRDSIKNITEFFRLDGTSPVTNINYAISKLRERGLVKLFYAIRNKTRTPMSIGQDEYTFIERGPGHDSKRHVWIQLTDSAFQKLKKHKVTSFYNLPRAKEMREKLKTRENRIYRRDFVNMGYDRG